jgi:metallo-beta-lactamase superfamily protein
MAVLLHVVYAGRGDALVVEDGSDFFPIDGGPLGYTARQHGGAPYWQYYYAALQAVAQAPVDGAIKPAGIVVSHAHEDHYGGLAAAFEQFLAPGTSRAGSKNLVFRGPLVTQTLAGPDDPETGALAELLIEFGFNPAAAIAAPLAQAFHFAADPPAHPFSRDAPLLPARVWSVDSSPANLASVLMAHRSGVLFTGDSVGYKVANYLDQLRGFDPAPADPLPILKVPHHGSLRNSQRAQAVADVPPVAWKQYALLCISSQPSEWDQLQMPADLRKPGAVAAANTVLTAICTREGIDLAALRREALAAFQRTMAAIAAGNLNPFQPPPLQERREILAAWLGVERELSRRQYNTRSGVSGTVAKRHRVTTPILPDAAFGWYAKLARSRFSDTFAGALAAVQLEAFFTDVAARNHVISADGSHAHPAAETLAAMAKSAASNNRQVRALVTDGYAVDLSRLNELAPNWTANLELRYLHRGARMVLDPSAPDGIGAFDPQRTTEPLATAATLAQIHQQLQRNRGATIPQRAGGDSRYIVRARDQSLHLRLRPDGSFQVTSTAESLYVDQAWTLSLTNPAGLPMPASFDDVRLRATELRNDASRLVTLLPAPSGRGFSLVTVQSTGGPRLYLCSDAATDYLTPEANNPTVLEFEFLLASGDAEIAAGAEDEAGGGAVTETLLEFCLATGVPISPPPSCEELLPELVGPGSAAALTGQIRSRLVSRALAWEVDLGSELSYEATPAGPLVTAAEIRIEPGSDLDFMIDGQEETIDSARLTIARDATSGALEMGTSVTTVDGTLVWDGGEDTEPDEWRSLDQYLFALGMEPRARANVTTGTLLTAIVGDEPSAEELLIRAPSAIVAAGIGEWPLDHEASEIETWLTSTGNWTELRAARLALLNPAPIEAEVAGLKLSFSQLLLVITDARLPTMEAALEATVRVGGSEMPGRAVLSDEGGAMEVSLPAGSDLSALLQLLPPEAAGIGTLEVPLAGAPLSSLVLAEPSFEVSQPSLGGTPYELSAAGGVVEVDAWEQALPRGWPIPLPGETATVSVIEPLEDSRALGLEVVFEVEIGPHKVDAVLGAQPLPAGEPDWSFTVGLHPDPASQPLGAIAALEGAGLAAAAAALPAQLPSLAPLLDSAPVVLLNAVLTSPQSGSEVVRVDLGLASDAEWEPLPGLAGFTLAQVALIYMDGRWSAEVEGDARVGPAGAVGASARLSTPEQGGSFSFENSSEELTVAALAALCGVSGLEGVPILGDHLGEIVDMIELAMAPAPAARLAGVGFSAGAEPVEAGVFELDAVELRGLVQLEGDGGPTTDLWVEGYWEEDLVVSLSYEEGPEPEKLSGTVQPLPAGIAAVTALERLLGSDAESPLLPALAGMELRNGTFAAASDGFELLSCALDLKSAATLPVAAATAAQLRANWVAAQEGEEEVPEVYLLEGRLSRKECEHEAALEIQFRNEEEEATTVAGTIRRLPPEPEEDEEEEKAKELTVARLLELLGLEQPEVLTPEEAPEFFEREPSSVEAVFSVDPFQLETLRIVVESGEELLLLPEPGQILLQNLTLKIDYRREPEEGEEEIEGVVFGELPLRPKAVTLAYTEPEGEEAAFRAEQDMEEEAPDYRRLIGASPYDPGYGVPDEPGMPAAIPMRLLTAAARPGEYVELSGYDEETAWEIPVGELEMDLGALGGRVRVTPGERAGAPHEFELWLFGKLAYHGFVGDNARFTWGPDKPSLLTATASEAADEIDVAAIATALGLPWARLIPGETPDFAFATAWTYLDLTEPRLPWLALYGDGALGPVKGPAALLSSITTDARSEFLFGAESGGAFPLLPLWQALGEIVDGHLDLTAGNLVVLGIATDGAGLDADLNALAEVAAEQSPEFAPPFADLPPLAEALPAGTELPAGLSVVATVDAEGEGDLNQALVEITEPETLPLLLVWGSIDPQQPRLSRFEVDLAGMVAFDGAIDVNGVAAYAPSSVEALLAPDATAHVEVGAQTCDFSGQLTVEAKESSFATADDGKRPTIEAPLGMTGLALRAAALTATYRYRSGKVEAPELRIDGFFDLEVEEADGEVRSLSYEGAIGFSGGKAAVAFFGVSRSLRATDLYLNAMTGGTWPAGYHWFGLEQPSLHAAPETVTVEGTEYEAGYHALATSSFLAHAFPLDLAIEEAGLRGDAASNSPIELGYLKLSEPGVSLFTGQPASYEVSGAAAIFGGDFSQLDFRFDPMLKAWTGATTYGGELVGVDEPEVSFEYVGPEDESRQGSLRLVAWPLQPTLDEEELDWEEELEEASEGSNCGKLEDLGLDEGENEDTKIETTFDLTMEELEPSAGDTLSVVLFGTYTVTVTSSEGERSTTMDFPDTAGTISPASGFQLDQLEDWVKETIKSNHAALGKSLLEDEDSEGEPGLESFLEEFGFEAAEAELIERILCREEGPEKVRTRAKHIVEETEEKATRKRQEAEDELEQVESSTTISGLFGFLLTFFAWITVVFQWIVLIGGSAYFGGLIGRIWIWLPPGRREEWEELVATSKRAEEEGERVRGWVETEVLAMRGFPDVAFLDRTTVEVSWDADNLPAFDEMNYEGFGGFSFEVEVATDPEFSSVVGTATVAFPLSTATIADPAFSQRNYAYARARAVYEEIPGTWIQGQAFHKIQLPAPEPVSQALDPAAGELTVTATAVPNAVSYAFELVDTPGGSVIATRDVTAPLPSPSSVTAVFTADDLPAEGTPQLLLLGRVRAIGDEVANEDSAATSAPQNEAVATLEPPQLNPPTPVPGGIQVTWGAVAESEGFTVRVLDSQGQPLSPQPDSTPAGLGCVLSGEGLVENAELKVEARAFAAKSIGYWSVPVPFTVKALSPPTGLRALYFWPEDRLRLSWEKVAGATAYEVEIVDETGQRLTPKVEFGAGPSAVLTGPGIAPERDYRVRVRGLAGAKPAIWGSWLSVGARALPPPEEGTLSYRRRVLWARWRPVLGASEYPLELERRGGGGGVPLTVAAPPGEFDAGDGVEPHLGEKYVVKIRAIVGLNVSDIAFVEGTIPTLLEVAMLDWSEEIACQETARECFALEPKVGPAQLWDTLVASGYSCREATQAVLAVLTGTSPAKLEAIEAALTNRRQAITLLSGESVPAAVIVAICHALYGPVPVQLMVLLKELKFAASGLAPTFAATFPLTSAEAELLVTAVYAEPWRLGTVFAGERQDCDDAAALLRRAYPPSLPLAASLAALNAAAYGEADLQRNFPASPQEWKLAWTATRGDSTGDSLATALKAAAISRADASGYVAACWPQLSEAQVKEAIAKAYGP